MQACGLKLEVIRLFAKVAWSRLMQACGLKLINTWAVFNNFRHASCRRVDWNKVPSNAWVSILSSRLMQACGLKLVEYGQVCQSISRHASCRRVDWNNSCNGWGWSNSKSRLMQACGLKPNKDPKNSATTESRLMQACGLKLLLLEVLTGLHRHASCRRVDWNQDRSCSMVMYYKSRLMQACGLKQVM